MEETTGGGTKLVGFSLTKVERWARPPSLHKLFLRYAVKFVENLGSRDE
jgi:hypothetical protein